MKKLLLATLSLAALVFTAVSIYFFNQGDSASKEISAKTAEISVEQSENQPSRQHTKRILTQESVASVESSSIVSEEKDEMNALFSERESSPMGIGSAEDRESRLAYELERMKSPITGEIPQGIRAKELEFAKHLPKKEEKTLTWNQMGQLRWGGRTRGVEYDILDTNIIIAGGVTGGLYRSTDGGDNFVKTTDPAQMHSVTSVTQDTRPGKENIWYAGTGENYGIVSATSFSAIYSGNGIFKSTDNGQSWTLLTSTMSDTPATTQVSGDFDYVAGIVIDHTNAAQDVVFAAVVDGIYKSTDGGATWTESLGFTGVGSQISRYAEIQISPTGILYATLSGTSTSKGYYRSADAGATWTKISIGITLPFQLSRTVLAINPSNENEVYFLANTPGSGQNSHKFWKYTYINGDGTGTGGAWVDRTSNLPNGSCTGYFDFNFGYYNSQSSYDMLIEVHPADGNTVYIGGTNLYKSSDAFATNTNTNWVGGYWCRTNPADYVYDGHHPDNHVLTFNPQNPNSALSGTDGGVSITHDVLADSIGWEHRNNGYRTTQFYTTSIEEADVSNDFVIGGLQDNGTWWTDNTSSAALWKAVHNDDGAYCAIPENRAYYIFCSQGGRMYKKSLDASGNVTNTQRIDPPNASGYSFINPFILDPNDNDQLYMATSLKLWRNNDLASITMTGDIYGTITTNWDELNDTQHLAVAGDISCLEMCKSAPDVLYYGTKKAYIYRVDGAGQATQILTELDRSEFDANAYMSSISTDPFNVNQMLVTFSNYEVRSIFHSLDGGQSFVSVGGNLEEFADGSGNGPAVFWAEVYPDGTFYVGTSIGLFSTTLLNGDNTVWVQEGPNEIGNVPVNMIKSRPFDGRVVVATHGGGMYFADAPPIMADINQGTTNNTDVSIYPNPVVDELTIEYPVEQTSHVKIELFDLNGKLIATLKDEEEIAGMHQVVWNEASQLSKGVYNCIITIDNMRISKKVVVHQ